MNVQPTVQPDHEFEVLEDDQTVPPRPEEAIADAARVTQEAPDPAAPGTATAAT
jgi:hypothetical protein